METLTELYREFTKNLNQRQNLLMHDLLAHILGGVLPTLEGEAVAVAFEQVLHPRFSRKRRKIQECIRERSGWWCRAQSIEPLLEEEIELYVKVALHYRKILKHYQDEARSITNQHRYSKVLNCLIPIDQEHNPYDAPITNPDGTRNI